MYMYYYLFIITKPTDAQSVDYLKLNTKTQYENDLSKVFILLPNR